MLTYEGITNAGRISPNGDGRLDTVAISYGVARKARVSVEVRKFSGKVVRRLDLGTQRPGGHRWRWNGLLQHRRTAPDGRYVVRLIAVPTGSHSRREHLDVRVSSSRHFAGDASFRTGLTRRFAVSRDAVYPDTTAVTDGVVVVTETPGAPFVGPTVRVRRASGGVVATIAVSGHDTPYLYGTWRGTDDDGARLPNGKYAVSSTWQDVYGNQLTSSRPVSIRSGTLHLVERSTTVSAAGARVSNGVTCTPPSPHMCADSPGSTPSTQYLEGLTFAGNGIGTYHGAVSGFEIALPWALDATHDEFRISYTGAPTNSGDTASDTAGRLSSSSEVHATTTAGGTTTTDWGRPDAWRAPYSKPYRDGVVWWSFNNSDDGTSYDVESFTVDVRHWAPPGS